MNQKDLGRFHVRKTYDHSVGLSCAFRQWRATDSHCRFIHGYALRFDLLFSAKTLDERNWVIDFGGFKSIKNWLVESFDHKLIVAADDPQLDEIAALAGIGVADVLVLDAVGCEQFAYYVWEFVDGWLLQQKNPNGVRLDSVICSEHTGNSASYGRVRGGEH